jgi:hypothetical protein
MPLLMAAPLLVACIGYPGLRWLVKSPSFDRLLVIELCLSALFAAYNGAMVAFLAESMPRSVRTAGFSLAFSLATALFGGFTPFVCTWLIHVTGDKAAPGLWLSAAAVIGLTGVMGLRALAAGRAQGTEYQFARNTIELDETRMVENSDAVVSRSDATSRLSERVQADPGKRPER